MKKAAKLSKPVRTAINRLINAKQEKKFTTSQLSQQFNSSIGNTGGPNGYSEFYSLIPAIPQGVHQNERVGDTVRPTSMVLNMLLTATDYASSFSGKVRIFVLEDLTIADANLQAVGLPNADLLLDAGGVQGPYDGTQAQHLMPTNKTRYRILHDRVVSIQKGTGNQGQLANSYTGDAVYATPASHHQLRFKLPTRKVWKYDADSDTLPSNQAVWLAIGYVNDNNVVDVTNLRVTAQWNTTVYFTDS